jgi:hypothetical protein
MTPFWKTLTFWISACSWIVVMGGHYVGTIPAPYGLVVSNAIAVVYTVLRCLQKRQAGIPWKAIVYTSEFAVTALTVLVNQLDAIKQIPSLPPNVLAIVSGGIAGLMFFLHALAGQGANKARPRIDAGPDILERAKYLPSGGILVPSSEAITKVERLKPTKE